MVPRPVRITRLPKMTDSPEWTDSNQSDPGVSLLELFAFLLTGYFFMNALGPILERTGLMKRVVSVDGDGEAWTRVDSLDGMGPQARVFRVDPKTGSVEFGDGVHGRVPPRSVRIETSYRYGVGAFGAIGAVAVGCVGWFLSLWARWRRRGLSGSAPAR
jgi:hypothetical protein